MQEDRLRTPKELGISEEQFEALQELRIGLCEGKFVHDKLYTGEHEFGFNMGTWVQKGNCGSVCCIGGWVDTLTKKRTREGIHSVASDLDRMNKPSLMNLFYPYGYIFNSIKPKQAAAAINNYLHGRGPMWKEVLSCKRTK